MQHLALWWFHFGFESHKLWDSLLSASALVICMTQHWVVALSLIDAALISCTLSLLAVMLLIGLFQCIDFTHIVCCTLCENKGPALNILEIVLITDQMEQSTITRDLKNLSFCVQRGGRVRQYIDILWMWFAVLSYWQSMSSIDLLCVSSHGCSRMVQADGRIYY